METKACIACAEDIKNDARLCKHCGVRQDDTQFTEPVTKKSEGETSSLKSRLAMIIAGVVVFFGVSWGGLAFAFPSDRADTTEVSSTQASQESDVSKEEKPSAQEPKIDPTDSGSTEDSEPQSTAVEDGISAQEAADTVQRQKDDLARKTAETSAQLEAELRAEAINDELARIAETSARWEAQWEAELRAEAIEEYETNLGNYGSQIIALEARLEKVYAEESVAYAEWEAKWGFPHERYFSTKCGDTDDMFGCIREHSNFPRYDLTISNIESKISRYETQINYLVYPY